MFFAAKMFIYCIVIFEQYDSNYLHASKTFQIQHFVSLVIFPISKAYTYGGEYQN
jgi:hypothetical protein